MPGDYATYHYHENEHHFLEEDEEEYDDEDEEDEDDDDEYYDDHRFILQNGDPDMDLASRLDHLHLARNCALSSSANRALQNFVNSETHIEEQPEDVSQTGEGKKKKKRKKKKKKKKGSGGGAV